MGRLHGRCIDVRGHTTRGGPAASTPSWIAIFIRQFRLLCPLKSAVAARGGLFFEQLRRLALQLPFHQVSESMGNHDSKIVDADSVD
jgi:hypothetical protein